MKVGLIGASGYWAGNLLRVLDTNKDIDKILLCDLDLKKLEGRNKEYKKTIIETDYSKVLKEVEAVLIATPPDSHYLLAVQALREGKHVFVEKPMTTGYVQARVLNQLAKQIGKVLMVGHTFVYINAIQYIKSLIDKGELGEIYNISFIFKNLGKYQKAGVGLDLLPHSVSLILYLTGKKIKFSKYFSESCVKEGIDDIGTLILKWDKGMADISISWLNPCKERRMTITGSKKMVIFDDISTMEKIKVYDKGVYSEKTCSSWGETAWGYRHGDIVIPHIAVGEPLKIEIEDFISSIKTGKEPISNGKLGEEVVRIMEEGMK